MNKKLVLLIVSVFTVLLVAGCGGGQSKETAGKEPIKVGALFPLSGNMALLGEESYRGVEMAAKVRNEKGGINGKQIELVKADAPDANAAQAEADRLVNQSGLKVIVGSYASPLSYAASEVAERNKASFWELGAVADKITQRGFKYTFRTCAPAASFAVTDTRFIEESLAPKWGVDPKSLRIAVVHEDSLYGSAIADGIKKIAGEKGWNLVAVQPYSSKAVDLSSVVMNLKNAKPDVLVAVSYLTDAILLSRQSKELDFNVKAFIGGGGGHTMTDFRDAFGADVDGVFDADFTQYATNPKYAVGIEDFVKLYEKTYGQKPRSGHSLANYMGAMVLFDTLEKAGSLDVDAIRTAALALDKPDGSTPTGWGVKFNPDTGQNDRALPVMCQWQNGSLVTVWPKEAAVAEYTTPMPTWAERAKK